MRRKHKSGLRNKTRILRALVIISGLTVLGCGVVYLGGKPIYDLLKAEFMQTVVNGSPNRSTINSKQEDGDEQESIKNQYGRIVCESIGLDVPLYFGDTEDVFLYGAGIYPGGSVPGEPGTTLISSHDTTYFKPLEEIKEGASIEIVSNHSSFRYRVREIKIQKAGDGFDVNGGSGDLVLYTCYPFGTSVTSREERFFVYCDSM